MIYINHRINTIDQLKEVSKNNGAEIDIRYHKNDLVLHHDPFFHHENAPEKFENFLKYWKHEGPLILNLKTEGVEKHCIALMERYQVKNWFFLDMSMPFFVRYAAYAQNNLLEGFSINNLAVRYSEYEPIEYALSFSGKAGWVWIDCFTHLPLNEESYERLKHAGFKICIVSPELQKHPISKIQDFKDLLMNFDVDAVCTKYPEHWA